MDLFLDLHQYGQIAKSRSEAAEAKNLAARFDARLADLERRTDRLALACQALWELLRATTRLNEEEVFKKMEEIDLRDGYRDGKIGGRIMTCSSCGRTINTHKPVCVYCGHQNPGGTVA